MATLRVTVHFPNEFTSLSKAITGYRDPGDFRPKTPLESANKGQHGSMNWNQKFFNLNGFYNHFNANQCVSISGIDTTLIPNQANSDRPFFSVLIPTYLTNSEMPTEPKDLRLTYRDLFLAMREHVTTQERGLWIGGRTEVTHVAINVIFDKEKPFERGPQGFEVRVGKISSRTLSATEMTCNALRCRGLVTEEARTLNLALAQIRDDARPKED